MSHLPKPCLLAVAVLFVSPAHLHAQPKQGETPRFDARTDADPYLGHGMSAASQVMLMRAVRSRANKLAEETAAGKQ